MTIQSCHIKWCGTINSLNFYLGLRFSGFFPPNTIGPFDPFPSPRHVEVPKMEGFLNLIRLFWGWGFPYISRIHTAYIGEDSSILGTWNLWWFLFQVLPSLKRIQQRLHLKPWMAKEYHGTFRLWDFPIFRCELLVLGRVYVSIRD